MKILFICHSNAERSQVAEVLFNHSSKRHRALSAGVNVTKENAEGDYAGKIISELLLGMGRDEILKKRRKQLTEGMAEKADKIVVMLTKDEIEDLLPDYVKSSPKTVFWELSPGGPSSVHNSFPPSTYGYHTQWVLEIEQHVKKLVKELG